MQLLRGPDANMKRESKLSDREDSNITWVTCPDCGAKIGVVISVGKSATGVPAPPPPQAVPAAPVIAQGGIQGRLAAAGVDLTLVDVEEGDEFVSVSPKKFLGDLWGPINEAIRTIGGGWIRDGRSSRWEIRKEELE
jgi:hypothetical protein